MNLGLIVLDTLRYDVFDDVMENTKRRADTVFERMYSTSRWTVPAHASLFTGLYPTEVGTHSDNHYLTTSASTLAERLNSAGFETYAFSNNPYVDSFFEFNRGFEHLSRGPTLQGRPTKATGFDWPELFSDLDTGPRKYLKAVTSVIRSDAPTPQTLANGVRIMLTSNGMSETATLDWLFDEIAGQALPRSEDTFLFANLMSCHSPYRPPSAYRDCEPYTVDPLELTLRDRPVTDEEHERHWECYTGAAQYLDDKLARIVNLYDWDALFIVADHGELFGEHGLRQHQYGVYEELVHVPAVAVGSLVPSGRTSELASLLDVHQTLLELADVDAKSNGINLFDTRETRDAVYAESTGNYRYSPDAKGLSAKIPASWADPHYTYLTEKYRYVNDKDGERVEAIDDGPVSAEKKADVRKVAYEFREGLDRTSTGAPDREITDDIAARLEHLGYR